jgi:urea carboxylase-associated protein 1
VKGAGVKIISEMELASGAHWAGVIEEGALLRIVDLEGQQAVDFLCYDAADPSDRYNAPDTMKYAGTIYLTTGHGLYSVRAKRLFTIVADTVGGHDTLAGCCSGANNRFRYGEPGPGSCYENFTNALRPFGLGERDIVPNINFFMSVPVAPDGALGIQPGISKAGDYVDLRADTRVLAVVSNCPQRLNPANNFNPTPIRLMIYRA